ncbi:MAG TPA: glycosyltransferase family 39 protein [Acidimicrobiales bacterium]|nr:glycosyltransferase family 39 protein [Acidimicrobiales bacterium]
MSDGGTEGPPPTPPSAPASSSLLAPSAPPAWGPPAPVRYRRAWHRLADRRRISRRWVFWQSPVDQPRWARPCLLLVAALAGLAYAWGLDNAALEPFYGAAARSMSSSWHNFLFGAFDPDGTVTVDKLPGALWLQALSLRAFGFHTWAIVLPQVVEGILTVLVLYRAVRRLAGALAGMIAALIVAASPVTILLNRGNISDSLLILLLVLAADATAAALVTGRLRSLLLAGLWVGLAFQAKMIQAWLVLPALWLAYLVASPGRAGRRLGHLLLATVVTAVVSLSWILAVSAVPAHDRPYVDGSRNDSEFAQVFDYNGLARFESRTAAEKSVGTPAAFVEVGLESRLLLNGSTAVIPRSWNRLLRGPLGRDTAWLLPAALLAGLAVLLARRRRSRLDPVRAGCLLFGTWLVVHLVAFSAGAYLNSYYTAALSPAIAALCGIGLSVAWRATRTEINARDGIAIAAPAGMTAGVTAAPAANEAAAPAANEAAGANDVRRLRPSAVTGRVVVAAVASGSAGYAVFLVPSGTAVAGWLVPAVIAAAVLADVLVLLSLRSRPLTGRLGSLTLTAATLVALLVPSVAAASVVADGLGPFDTPFEPAAVTLVTQTDVRRFQQRAIAAGRELTALAGRSKADILFVTDTSAIAAPYILATGREVLPIGGFVGANPAPTLKQIQLDIAFGRVHFALVPIDPPGVDPRVAWIRDRCRFLSHAHSGRVLFGFYDCTNTARS